MSKAISSNKREIEKKKQSKRLEKQKRKEERKANGTSSFDDMIAYVDENGMITDTPPDLTKKTEVDIEDIEISVTKKEEEDEAPKSFNGVVEYFNHEKGFGFIKDVRSVEKYFFHISAAPATISEGDKVTFELEKGKKGMNAVRIEIK
jgi:cold shock CspA family protein